jgi:Kef-type K+ transport system membrane component KefB
MAAAIIRDLTFFNMPFTLESLPLAFLFTGGAEAATIPLMMLLVFGSAKLFAEGMEAIGQPGLVGQILAGILIGPSVLGWVQPTDFLGALSDLGVMFLLFQVGLEVKPSDLFAVGRTALVVAILGVVVPFALGYWILLAWGEPRIEAIFVGAAMVATSVGITARVLASKGLLQHLASRTILAAAVIDDILGLLVLAMVSSMAKGSVDYVSLGITAALAIGFTVIVATLGTRTIDKVMPAVESKLRAGEAQFGLAMVLLFGLSVAAVYTGIAAIVGAFLAGMALSQSVNKRVHDLSHGVTELLVPFFLAGIGLHLELWELKEPSIILLAGVILVAAILSKLIGCGLGAWPLGRANMFRIGVGMVPRGEVGMVVAQIGMSMGVVNHAVYGVVVFMAVLTTVAAPPLLKIAFRDAASGNAEERFTLG